MFKAIDDAMNEINGLETSTSGESLNTMNSLNEDLGIKNSVDVEILNEIENKDENNATQTCDETKKPSCCGEKCECENCQCENCECKEKYKKLCDSTLTEKEKRDFVPSYFTRVNKFFSSFFSCSSYSPSVEVTDTNVV